MSVFCHLSARTRASVSRVLKPYACLATVLAATLLLSVETSAKITFTAEQIASGDKLSVSTVTGDFNNDGILDLVTINYTSISFYKGLGNGQYAAPVNSQLGPVNPGHVQTSDFNRDGKLDLAVANSGGGVAIFLGNGDGTFTPGDNIVDSNGPTLDLALADFNGDHLADVAFNVCPPPGGPCYIDIYLGQGDGTFKFSGTLNNVGGGPIVAGDFNADGHQDLAVSSYNVVELFLGQGNGQFQAPLSVSQQYAAGLEVGDFYNDRIQTLAVLNMVGHPDGSESAYVDTIRYSNGQLVATNPQFIMKQPFLGVGIAAGDINGDFKDDLFVTGSYGYPNQTYFAGYMLGNGKGGFGRMANVPSNGVPASVFFVRDLNLDSRHDVGLVWSNAYPNGGGAYVLINNNAKTNCDPPPANKIGVNICAPMSGQSVPTTFTFKGSGNAFSGIAKRMELWLDGTKVGQNLEDQLKVTATMSKGTHTATFVVVDTFDDTASQSVTFTVK